MGRNWLDIVTELTKQSRYPQQQSEQQSRYPRVQPGQQSWEPRVHPQQQSWYQSWQHPWQQSGQQPGEQPEPLALMLPEEREGANQQAASDGNYNAGWMTGGFNGASPLQRGINFTGSKASVRSPEQADEMRGLARSILG